MPTVSVVVPAYNNSQYIAETIESIQAQTYQDLEIIISDHSSTDGTMDIIQRYADDPRITVMTTEAGGGARRNWNAVSQAATGTYLKLVCGDDLLYPELIERQVAAIEQNPAVTLVASKRDIVDAHSTPFVKSRGLAGLSGVVPGGRAVRATVVAGTNIFGEPGCTLIRRDVLERVGWWDDAHPYLIDETTYARVLLEGDLYAVDESLAGFRVSGSLDSAGLLWGSGANGISAVELIDRGGRRPGAAERLRS